MDTGFAVYGGIWAVAGYAAVFLLTISFVVFLHEMGHYLTARYFGVRVKKFSIGFGRELCGFTAKETGTRWSLSAIPLGGYVEIFGYGSSDEVLIWDEKKKERRPLTEEEKPHAFCEKKLWQRILIVAMGPLINFIFAFFIFFAMFISIGEGSTRPLVTAVAMDAAGYEAGIWPMDFIAALDGEPLRRFEDVWEKSMEPHTTLHFLIERDGKILEFDVTSRLAEYRDLKGIPRSHGRIGVTNFPAVQLKHITSVNGVPAPDDKEALRAMLVEILDEPARLGIQFSDKEAVEFLIMPRTDMNEPLMDPNDEDHDFFHLLQTDDPYFIQHDIFNAVKYAGKRVYFYVDESIRFISVLIMGQANDQRIGGLATMGNATRKAVNLGFVMYFTFLAILSIQIGFINLLPIPALDGGYLVFFSIEAITGKALPERIQDYALTTGMILLFGLMIFANISDILQFTF